MIIKAKSCFLGGSDCCSFQLCFSTVSIRFSGIWSWIPFFMQFCYKDSFLALQVYHGEFRPMNSTLLHNRFCPVSSACSQKAEGWTRESHVPVGRFYSLLRRCPCFPYVEFTAVTGNPATAQSRLVGSKDVRSNQIRGKVY